MKNQQLQDLYTKFAHAEFMVANGGKRENYLTEDELTFLLGKFLHYLVASKRVQPYSPKQNVLPTYSTGVPKCQTINLAHPLTLPLQR